MLLATKDSRHKAILQVMGVENLKALLLIGDTNVGPGFCGDFRYYTNSRVIFYRQVILVFPDSEPVLFAGSEIQRQAASKRSFVSNCIFSNNLIVDLSNLLKERGVLKGKVGVNFEMLPTAWYMHLKRELPEIELVEMHEQIMRIRFQRSREEIEIYRRGAALGDGGFERALKVIQPGISEYEIAAEIEHYGRFHGAEEDFTLIGSGKFTFGRNNSLPLPYSPSNRRVELGDSIVMEITPRYESYWTQLVRTVNVGMPNKELLQVHDICRNAILRGVDQLKPGKKVKDVVFAMESYVANCGFMLGPPIGHICGVDLIEDRVSRENGRVLESGTALIIHPTVFTSDGMTSFFWGETYLITSSGHERLHYTGDELLTL